MKNGKSYNIVTIGWKLFITLSKLFYSWKFLFVCEKFQFICETPWKICNTRILHSCNFEFNFVTYFNGISKILTNYTFYIIQFQVDNNSIFIMLSFDIYYSTLTVIDEIYVRQVLQGWARRGDERATNYCWASFCFQC